MQTYGIERVADVRKIPQSRYNPQYGQAALRASLAEQNMDYVHLPGLGGKRPPQKESINTGWENASFRAYADYMQTAEFAHSLQELIALAQAKRTVLLCAEAVPWRCHRSLIADALLVRHIEVLDILGATSLKPHALTAFARVEGTTLTYPPIGDSPQLRML